MQRLVVRRACFGGEDELQVLEYPVPVANRRVRDGLRRGVLTPLVVSISMSSRLGFRFLDSAVASSSSRASFKLKRRMLFMFQVLIADHEGLVDVLLTRVALENDFRRSQPELDLPQLPLILPLHALEALR